MVATSWLGALFLGILQGITEFLPVSSSGHLTLFTPLVGQIGDERILFNLVLHMGTLVPVIFFYREQVKELITGPFTEQGALFERRSVKMWTYLIMASIPTAIIGLMFKDVFETVFSTPGSLVIPFAATGVLLWVTGRNQGSGERALSIPIALLLGLAQGIAITPGVSRSGSTIAVALLIGMEREEAARFSFLMSIPAIVGGLLLELKDADFEQIDVIQYSVGGFASMITGYLALAWLVKLVKSGGFKHFAWWVWAMAIFSAVLAWTT